MHSTKWRIAYFSLLHSRAGDGYLGAALVLNEKGFPLEFRCTQPVKPNALQRVVFGNSLVSHIMIDLCGLPLIESLKSEIDLVVFNEEQLLEMRPLINVPAISIRKRDEGYQLSEHLRSAVCQHPQFFEDEVLILAKADFDADISLSVSIVEDMFVHFPPVEPFERLEKAVELLSSSDKRFQ